MSSDDPMAAGRGFVERGRERGKSDQELRQALQASGWSETALDAIWSRLGPVPAPTGPAPQPPAAEPADAGDEVLPDWELDVDDQPAAARTPPPARMYGDGNVAALDHRSVGFVLIPEPNVRGWLREQPGFRMEDGAVVMAANLAHWLSPAGGWGHQVSMPQAVEMWTRASVRRVQSAAEVVPEIPAPHRGPAYLVEFHEPPVPGGKIGLHPDCIALLNEQMVGWVMLKEKMVRENMQECGEPNRDMAAFLGALALGPILCHGAPVTFSDQEELTAACRRSRFKWHPSGWDVVPGLALDWNTPVCVVGFQGLGPARKP